MAAPAPRGALALLLTMAFSFTAQAGAIEFEGGLVDEQGRPLAGLPIRVVFDGDADPRAAEAGLRLSTDADGRFRRRIERAPKRRFITLDTAFIPHRATSVSIGVELELVGRRALYWIELDYVKGGTLSRMTAHLAGRSGRFDQVVRDRAHRRDWARAARAHAPAGRTSRRDSRRARSGCRERHRRAR